ncbi:Retinal guanylyl cyclase 1 [Schistosoma japonicum]|nr:Retinal guanylyl cyclase 1 [Schistosoma japonicum]
MAEKNKGDSIESVESTQNINVPPDDEQSFNPSSSIRRKSSNYSVHFTGENSTRPSSSSRNGQQNKMDTKRRKSNKGPLPPVD